MTKRLGLTHSGSLALLPLRLRDFAALRIGITLVQVEDHWQIVIPARETKSGRAEQRKVPNLLQPCLTRYIRNRGALQRSQGCKFWENIF